MLKRRPIIPILNAHQWEANYVKEFKINELDKETREIVESKLGLEGSKKEVTIRDLTDEQLIEFGKDLKDTYDEIQISKATIKKYNYKLALDTWNGFNNVFLEEKKRRGLK